MTTFKIKIKIFKKNFKLQTISTWNCLIGRHFTGKISITIIFLNMNMEFHKRLVKD